MRRRWAWGLAAAVLVVLAAGGAAGLARVDALRPELEAAALRATGRALVLGPLHLRLWGDAPGAGWRGPVLVADGASLANLGGGSRPQMLTARRVAARLSLRALLHGRFGLELALDAPDLLLERTASGPNWVFTPERPAAAPSAISAAPSAPRQVRTWLEVLQVTNGVATWRYEGGGRARATVLGQTRATLAEPVQGGPVTFDAELTAHGSPFTLHADMGALSALSEAPDRPLPVRVAVATGAAHAQADGTVVPASGAFDLTLQADVPALERLRPLLPHADLPALHDLRLAARVQGAGTGPPAVSGVTVQLGASDLGPLVPGLSIAGATLAALAPDRPVQLALDGALGTAGLHLGGTVGPLPAGLAGAGAAPVPVDLSARLGSATLTLSGRAARVGADLVAALRLGDVAGLPLPLRAWLPALRDVTLDARVGTPDANTLTLGGLRLASSAGDAAGDLVLAARPVPGVSGTLTSQRLDWDALAAAWEARPRVAAGGAASGVPGRSPQEEGQGSALDPLGVAPPDLHSLESPRAAGGVRVMPDRVVPFALLRRAAGDLAVRVAALRLRGADWRDLAAHAVLDGGRLAVDPLTVQAPEGPLRLVLHADAAAPGSVSLALAAPGLQLAPLLAQLGRPGQVEGTLALDAALAGRGATTRALAATLDGHVTLSVAGGTVQDALLEQLFGTALRGAGVPVLLTGQTPVRCLALGLDFAAGQGTLRTLALDSSRLVLTGTGGLSLRDETLDLALRPSLRLGPEAIGAPLRVGGTFAAPSAKVDTSLGALSFGAAGAVADPCPGVAPRKAEKPADVLRRLFR